MTPSGLQILCMFSTEINWFCISQIHLNLHLQQYINVEKLLKALTLLRNWGHKYYQFPFEKNVQSYKERLLKEDRDGYEVMYQESDDESIIADDLEEASKIDDSSLSDDNLKKCFDASSASDDNLKESVDDEVDKSNISSSSDRDNDSKNEKSRQKQFKMRY